MQLLLLIWTFFSNIISYTVDPAQVHLYWKDNNGHPLGSLQHLKDHVQPKQLIFAMNGGMFKPDGVPVGLFIQDKKIITPLDTTSGNGNFYLKPNGVFYITTAGKAAICETAAFINHDIQYATQSGPMLISNGLIHPAFKEGSANLNIRNGVGILPDGKLVFALSKEAINFYDFAMYFKQLGCVNALYLDGYVSRMYLPSEKWIQTDGNFGVMIGVTK